MSLSNAKRAVLFLSPNGEGFGRFLAIIVVMHFVRWILAAATGCVGLPLWARLRDDSSSHILIEYVVYLIIELHASYPAKYISGA
jgi:hypothetical protein